MGSPSADVCLRHCGLRPQSCLREYSFDDLGRIDSCVGLFFLVLVPTSGFEPTQVAHTRFEARRLKAAFTLHNLLKARKRSCRNPPY